MVTVIDAVSREDLRAALESEKRALGSHPIYEEVSSLRALRRFMERHVVCVLDFMSLLKSLQRDLTRVSLPWVPPAHPELARLINEIVLGEESDEVAPGRFSSHYEWYLSAMDEVGADTGPIRRLEGLLREGVVPTVAIDQAGLPAEAAEFTHQTFAMLMEPAHVRAAVFFHGREDVIPRMFSPLVGGLQERGQPCGTLAAYLRRHVEIDGEAHGPAAERMLATLFAGDPHKEQTGLEAALASLRARRRLWDQTRAALGA